jgi:antitoxin component YwqK of YwqJK toxin-antitoxin module
MKKNLIPPFPILSSLFLLLSLAMVQVACKPAAKPKPAATAQEKSAIPDDLSGMKMEDIPGTDTKYARQFDGSGAIQIEGFVRDNKKTGQWILYGAEGDIGLINNYVDGKLEGVAMRMTFRNQVDLKSNYHNGVLNGPWLQYKFGKKIEERNYKNGQLDGSVKVYDERTFKLKQEAEYKDGLQDGFFRYYDENGNVTLEYEYKKGEKVSGGMKTQ